MYHPMISFALMQTRQEDLLRDLPRRERRLRAARRVEAGQPSLRRRLMRYAARRPRPATAPAPSVGS
jgi:hypothetical protein